MVQKTHSGSVFKVISIILIIVMVLCVFYSASLVRTNHSLKNQLENEKIKAERLLSEKLQLEKELSKLKKEENP